MFSFMLRGNIGEYVAPRPLPTDEFHLLLKAGKYDDVLAILRETNHGIPIDDLGPSGEAPIHLVAASGDLELLVELLSQGVNVNRQSDSGHVALHYATINNKKAVVEILIRSGADPSIPNSNGIIPAEMATDPRIRAILLRNTLLSSGIKTTLPSDQYHHIDPIPALDTSSSASTRSISTYVGNTNNSLQVDNQHTTLTSSPGRQFPSPRSPPKRRQSMNNVLKSSKLGITETFETPKAHSPTTRPFTDELHLPTVMTMESLPRPSYSEKDSRRVNKTKPVRRYSIPPGHPAIKLVDVLVTSQNNTLSDAKLESLSQPNVSPKTRRGSTLQAMWTLGSDDTAISQDEDYLDSNNSKESHKGNEKISSKANRTPPSSSPNSASASDDDKNVWNGNDEVVAYIEARTSESRNHPDHTPTLTIQEASVDDDTYILPPPVIPTYPDERSQLAISTSPVHTNKIAEINFDIQTPLQNVKPVVPIQRFRSVSRGKINVLRSSSGGLSNDEEEYIETQDCSTQTLEPEDNKQLVSKLFPFINYHLNITEAEQMHILSGVLKASYETSLTMKMLPSSAQKVLELVKYCQTSKNNSIQMEKLKKTLNVYPELATCRACNCSNYCADGSTLLHVAAKWSNVEAIKILVEIPAISAWSRDLQGRVPLHLASEALSTECCNLLLNKMQTENVPWLGPLNSRVHIDGSVNSIESLLGTAAPIDISGTTPLGWMSNKVKQDKKNEDAHKTLEKLLFRPGDRTILPKTPFSCRSGCTPLRSKTAAYKDFMTSGTKELFSPVAEYASQGHHLVYASGDANGWRPSMEDRVVIKCPVHHSVKSWNVFGVLDGHGGDFSSDFTSKDLLVTLESAFLKWHVNSDSNIKSISDVELEEIVSSAILHTESNLRSVERMEVKLLSTDQFSTTDNSGTTLCFALITDSKVCVANVGDSRAVLAYHLDNELVTKAMSEDHKFSIEGERERAEAAGATVEKVDEKVWQVFTPQHFSKLRMSRSLGDFTLKNRKAVDALGNFHPLPPHLQPVSCIPEFRFHERTSSDAFLVIACDGIWDVMSNEEVVAFVASQFEEKARQETSNLSYQKLQEILAEICDLLLGECIKKGSRDNMSLLIILFEPYVSKIQLIGATTDSPNADAQRHALSPLVTTAKEVDDDIDSPVVSKHLVFENETKI